VVLDLTAAFFAVVLLQLAEPGVQVELGVQLVVGLQLDFAQPLLVDVHLASAVGIKTPAAKASMISAFCIVLLSPAF